MDQNDKEAEVRAVEFPRMLMYPGLVSLLLGLSGFLSIPWVIEDQVGIQRIVTFALMTIGCFFFVRDGWLLITKKAKTILPHGRFLIGLSLLNLIGAIIILSSEDWGLGFFAVGSGAIFFTAGMVPFKCRTQFKEWRDSQGKEEA